jgi:hypothetical protein
VIGLPRQPERQTEERASGTIAALDRIFGLS